MSILVCLNFPMLMFGNNALNSNAINNFIHQHLKIWRCRKTSWNCPLRWEIYSKFGNLHHTNHNCWGFFIQWISVVLSARQHSKKWRTFSQKMNILYYKFLDVMKPASISWWMACNPVEYSPRYTQIEHLAVQFSFDSIRFYQYVYGIFWMNVWWCE